MERLQNTISKGVMTRGVGFLTGADVAIGFLPAAEGTGIRFRRVDLYGSPDIPARWDFVVTRQRRTAISNGDASVELVEHIMAALAGLRIDNCIVELNAPEAPGGDGSSLLFVDALVKAGTCPQRAMKPRIEVTATCEVLGEKPGMRIEASPHAGLSITYQLDYGPNSPIPQQSATFEITPEVFLNQIASARTFVLEAEVNALRAQGYGSRTTEKDLLIFGKDGPIGNAVRFENECARHKLLDCLGDFALCGCDLTGRFVAQQTGHNHNHAIIREVLKRHSQRLGNEGRVQRAA